MLDLTNISILITGGTGSLGKALTQEILTKHPEVRRIIIFSRDEQKQFQMAQEYPEKDYPQIRYFIGDVRDRERLIRAFKGVDYVIHAAAIVDPLGRKADIYAVNVEGTKSVLDAAAEAKLKDMFAQQYLTILKQVCKKHQKAFYR